MGSCYNFLSLKACDEPALRKKFLQEQDDYCNQYGSDTYAGHIGIVKGLDITKKSFKTVKEAEDFVMETAQKWEAAIAVKVGDFSKVFPITATEKKDVIKLNELQANFDNWESNLIKRVKESKSSQRGCKSCGSKIAVKYLKQKNCPICGDIHFVETDQKAFKSLKLKLKEQSEKVCQLEKKYADKNKNNFWYVGAWCAE
jgi:predicted RNA-binding Zn-ribbon protein involved in translation (DUF1610 family)